MWREQGVLATGAQALLPAWCARSAGSRGDPGSGRDPQAGIRWLPRCGWRDFLVAEHSAGKAWREGISAGVSGCLLWRSGGENAIGGDSRLLSRCHGFQTSGPKSSPSFVGCGWNGYLAAKPGGCWFGGGRAPCGESNRSGFAGPELPIWTKVPGSRQTRLLVVPRPLLDPNALIPRGLYSWSGSGIQLESQTMVARGAGRYPLG